MIGARRELFGDDAIDPASGRPNPGVCALVWLGVSTFALALAGRVVLLDAWIPRGTTRFRGRVRPSDLAALEPEAVLIGHGHVDHAADATEILDRCDAILVASSSYLEGRTSGAGRRVSAASDPGEVRPLPDVIDDVELVSVGHHHSTVTWPTEGLRPLIPLPDLRAILRDRPRVEDLRHLARHLTDGAGTSVAYQLRGGGFSITWHDTSGPSTPEVLDALRSLPSTDIHLGAIMGFGQLTNGLRDPRRYVEALQPDVFVPHHHDDWLPPLTAPGSRYRGPLDRELGRLPADARPAVHFLSDPDDYERPLVWRR